MYFLIPVPLNCVQNNLTEFQLSMFKTKSRLKFLIILSKFLFCPISNPKNTPCWEISHFLPALLMQFFNKYGH